MFDNTRFDDTHVIPALGNQLALFADIQPVSDGKTFFSAPAIDLSIYDTAIVCSSGGKDSIASLCRLLEMGFDPAKIELWHHDVDGHEGSQLMDWVFMRDYVRQFGEVMGLPVYFSWLDGGFEGEMLKENSYSRPHKVETPDGLIVLERDKTRSTPGTRLRFPQLSPSLQTRWCSSALKIDVGRRALNNQNRFDGKSVLFITGERRDESANRSRYNQFEPHACDRRDGRKARRVDAWRPVLEWDEAQVWDILERHRIIAPIPYRLGWNRSSCMTCIYNNPRIWATIGEYFPERLRKIADYEDRFGTTISRSKVNVKTVAASSQPIKIADVEALQQSMIESYHLPIILPENQRWELPAGAFGKEGCGAD